MLSITGKKTRFKAEICQKWAIIRPVFGGPVVHIALKQAEQHNLLTEFEYQESARYNFSGPYSGEEPVRAINLSWACYGLQNEPNIKPQRG